MVKIRKAVILAAGLGTRLKPLTDELPKCLTEVNGKTIMEHSLEILGGNGIEETVVVIGYLGNTVIDRIGLRHGDMKITYIWNQIYAETNSMYSAWLAREYLERGAILIEGDTIFEEALITKVLQQNQHRTYWVVDRFTPQHDGSMSTTNGQSRIVDLRIVREKLSEYRDNYYKSTGVLKLTPGYGKKFSRWLDDDVNQGNVKIYYDLVIARHLMDAPIYICDFTGGIWTEIDNMEDLEKAEKVFKSVVR